MLTNGQDHKGLILIRIYMMSKIFLNHSAPSNQFIKKILSKIKGKISIKLFQKVLDNYKEINY